MNFIRHLLPVSDLVIDTGPGASFSDLEYARSGSVFTLTHEFAFGGRSVGAWLSVVAECPI